MNIHPSLVTTASADDIRRLAESTQGYEPDDVDSFCRAMKIGRTAFYEDVGRGLIKIVKRGKKTLIPPGERCAYLERLAAAASD